MDQDNPEKVANRCMLAPQRNPIEQYYPSCIEGARRRIAGRLIATESGELLLFGVRDRRALFDKGYRIGNLSNFEKQKAVYVSQLCVRYTSLILSNMLLRLE